MPILYLSKYIIKTKNDYYSALRKVIEKQEWEQWILYILNGVTEIADWTKDKITSIRDLLEHTCDYVQQKEPRLY